MRTHLKEYDGLYAAKFMIESGIVLDPTYSVAAMADSAYEYILKEWLATGKKEQKYLDMCTFLRLRLSSHNLIAH